MKQGHSCATQVCPVHGRRVSGHFALHPLALALACLVMPECALALPEGFNPVSGLVNQNLATPGVMNLQQGSDRAIVNWNSFNIGPTESVNISQPNANSAMLNRVTGGVSSSIAGSLTANGRVFLVNPSGVVFGAGSRVSTGGLVASTLNISDDDFNNGRWNFSRAADNTAQVLNLGDLRAATGGTIALLGATVTNGGTITADGGTAALVSSQNVTVDFFNDGLTKFTIPNSNIVSPALVENTVTGKIQADGGRVVIEALAIKRPEDIPPLVVNLQGELQAHSLVNHNGEIFLTGGVLTDPNKLGGNRIQIGGKLDASGIAGAPGGQITILGAGLYLNDTASLDVSGASGGGRIDVVAKESAALARGSSLTANALADGIGGTLNLQGGRSLTAHGSLQARGVGSGVGGSVVTSAQAVNLAGVRVDAAGAAGQLAGTWLIDPFNITVSHDSGDGCCVLNNPFDLVTAANSVVMDSAINTSLNSGSNVRIHTAPTNGNNQLVDFNSINATGSGTNIVIGSGAYIHRTQGDVPVGLRFESDDSISGNDFYIKSDSGPLDVIINSNANATEARSVDGTVNLVFPIDTVIDIDGDGTPDKRSVISTHGGGVSIFGGKNSDMSASATKFDPSIQLHGLEIDTTTAAESSRDASVSMRGSSTPSFRLGAIDFKDVTVHAGNGDVTLNGLANLGFSVLLLNSNVIVDEGDVSIVGVGGFGMLSDFSNIDVTAGDISLTGSSDSVTALVALAFGNGHIKANNGDILIKGDVIKGEAGVQISPFVDIRADVGDISITGSATQIDDGVSPSSGLFIAGGNITTESGNIDLRGRVELARSRLGFPDYTAGLMIDLSPGGLNISSQTGNVSLAGEATNGSNTNGLRVISSLTSSLPNLPKSVFAGNRLDILASSNEPTQLAFDFGDLSLTGMKQINLRPGGVGADGKLVENSATPIQLGFGPVGSSPVSNFLISQQTLDQLHTSRLTVGSAIQAAPIVVAGNINVVSDTQITLQAEGKGGSIDLRAPLTVTDGTLALLADGQISQSNTGTLTSEQLLAISHNGSVLLNNPANAPHVIAGRAAGDFSFTNVDDLSIGTVEGTSGVQAGTVSINTLEGNLSVDQAVTATAGSAVLDSAGTLDVKAPLSVANGTLALSANGQINQSGTGALTSEQLLAISRNDSVLLNNPANAPHVIAGRAAGDFSFTNVDDLSIGTIEGTSGVQAGTVSINTLEGKLSVDQAVTATAGSAVLDSAGTLDVNAPVSVANGTLALSANGQINQNDPGTLTSEQLLAISRNGSVLLNNPANASHVVAGSAAQAFAFTGAGNLNVGAVGGTSGVQAGTVALRNLAGDISVDQAVTATAGRAVLDSAGAMAVNAPVSVPNGTLSLTANGQISQAGSGALTSEQLLAVSRNASVLLNNPANAPHVVAGTAAGDFAFTNADNLSIGTVDGVSGVQAGTVFIRNLDGDLTLDQPVVATAGSAVLVTGGRLQNPAGQTISASTFWQIWANTWIGENRGGLVGSGRLANLYGCAFGGNCASAAGLAATAGDNHFLYLQQPTAQVTIASGSGPFGVVPLFRSSISGLVLGDSGNGISGSPDSAFSQVARPGTFFVGGTFTSAEGYLVTVVPGTWTNYLFGAVDARPDWTRERPDTWLYDHNMGGSPMCAAPGVTVASAVQQGDVLAREWSLVKSRPKLSSCVASDKQNGCSDF